MTANFRKVDEALRDVSGQVVLVSFTVDPERDTGERLTAYAKSQGAGDHWLFLRGPREEVVRLSREGFLLGASVAADPGTPPREPGTEPIAHDRHFVLVDRMGRIRGYYDGLEDAAVAAVARDARALLRETPPAP
jgi:protein SCO1/2